MATPTRERAATCASSFALPVLAGLASVAQPWPALARFHMVDLVPVFAGLSLVRVSGPAVAAVVTSLHVTTSLRAGAAPSWRRAAIAALTVPVAAVPVTALAASSASVVTWLGAGLGPRAFVARLLLVDFAYGLLHAAVLGLVPAVLTRFGARLLGRVHGFAAALAATGLVSAGASAVVGAIVSTLVT